MRLSMYIALLATACAGGRAAPDGGVSSADARVLPEGMCGAACYRGPSATLDVGDCRAGTWVCVPDGDPFCEGEIVPYDEVCGGGDEDCDGRIDEGCDHETALSVGEMHACRLHDGALECWGANYHRELGVVSESACDCEAMPARAPFADVQRVVAGPFRTCAFHSDDRVSCWGQCWAGMLGQDLGDECTSVDELGNRGTEVPHVMPIERIEELAMGRDHTCARTRDGGLYCFGFAGYGQLGAPTTESCAWVGGDVSEPCSTTPLPVPLDGVDAITAGDRFTCALADGTVHCFGMNESGQIGEENGERCRSDFPCVTAPRAMLDRVVAIDAGFSTVCAIRDDGTLWCWGANQYGQLGQSIEGRCPQYGSERGAYSCSNVPLQVPGLSDVVEVSMQMHVCARTGEGRVHCWGEGDRGQLAYEPTTTCDRFGMDLCDPTPREVPQLFGARSIQVGYSFTCAELADGQIACVGHDYQGQLGQGEPSTWRSDLVIVP